MMSRVAALLALAACGDDPRVFAEPNTIDLSFPSTPNRKVDLLLQIDDSNGAPDKQAHFAVPGAYIRARCETPF